MWKGGGNSWFGKEVVRYVFDVEYGFPLQENGRLNHIPPSSPVLLCSVSRFRLKSLDPLSNKIIISIQLAIKKGKLLVVCAAN